MAPNKRVGSRREDRDRPGGRVEVDARAGRASDPVALHRLQRVGPVEAVEVGEQAVGVGGDAHHPLAHRPLEHREVAAVAAPVGGDLLVGDDGAEAGAPVDRCLGDVGEALRVDDGGALALGQRRPRPPVRCLARSRLVLGDQLGDRPRPAGAAVGRGGIGVVPRVEDAGEDPLRPAVVGGIGRLDRAAPVVAHPQSAQLGAVVGDVLGRGDRRMLAGLHGELLGGQTEGVEAHRVQHVAPRHPGVPRVHVGADVAEGVADVQPVVRRVREHVEDEQLLAGGGHLVGLGERAGRVRRLEHTLVLPDVLPAQLDLGRRARRCSGTAARRRRRRMASALNWWFPST